MVGGGEKGGRGDSCSGRVVANGGEGFDPARDLGDSSEVADGEEGVDPDLFSHQFFNPEKSETRGRSQKLGVMLSVGGTCSAAAWRSGASFMMEGDASATALSPSSFFMSPAAISRFFSS